MKTLLPLLFFWLASTSLAQPPVVRPKILGVAHVAVFVSDLPKALAFYEGPTGHRRY